MSNQYTYNPPFSKEELLAAYSIGGLSQVECAEKFGCTQKVIWKAMKRFEIHSRTAAKRNQRGENNHMWKGGNATKYAFHRRLYHRFGKPTKCAICGTSDVDKSYDYANLTGRYEDLSDYLPMCRSCHWKYDKKVLNIKHMRAKDQ